MALTATANKTLRKQVSDMFSMKNTVLVSVSPDKSNIKYLVAKHATIEKTFAPFAKQLYDLQLDVGQKLDNCCKLYRFFQERLGHRFTFPNGSPNLCRNRIVDMFHSCTEPCIKDTIIKSFSTLGHLRVVIATIAFEMGFLISVVLCTSGLVKT